MIILCQIKDFSARFDGKNYFPGNINNMYGKICIYLYIQKKALEKRRMLMKSNETVDRNYCRDLLLFR